MNRTKDKRFKKDYSKTDILNFINGVANVLRRTPTSRDLNNFPGPAPRTIIRRFGSWSEALKEAGLRPSTHQLKKGERSFIRKNWRKMTDKEIATELGVTEVVIKYYRKNFNLWKNRKGTAKSTYRRKAFLLYGDKCEVCGLGICDWHHLLPRSTNPEHWCILCPTCHAVITRGLIRVNSREDLQGTLKPYIAQVYKELNLN